MQRRAVLAGFAATMAAGQGLWPARASAQIRALDPLWTAWADRFVDYSGRVIDEAQMGASHSEGQGYGLLLAAMLGDRARFEAIDDWTQRNLAIRSDALLAWRWLPGQAVHVPDTNNASDGDLFHAWALLRGARRFGDAALARRASRIAEDLAGLCCAARPDRPDQTLFLPAEKGFVHGDRVTFNASYVMPLAMTELAEATDTPLLRKAARDSLTLMADVARTGPVPDWVQVAPGGVVPAAGFAHRVGYEALRIPLFLMWSSLHSHPAVQRARTLHAGSDGRGTVFDPLNGSRLQSSGDPGYRAITALLSCSGDARAGAPIPPFTRAQPYYPATLHLFTMIAQMEGVPRCVPI